MKLTEKQQIFVDTYLRLEPNNPDVDARAEAGMTAYKCNGRKSALVVANENLAKDSIIEYISKKRPDLLKNGKKSNGDMKPSKVLSNARRVAVEVKKQIGENRLPNIKKAMLKVGYSEISSSKLQAVIKRKKEYKREIANLPEMLDELILDAVDIMKDKKTKASYKDGMSTVKDLNKTKRLIEGKSTSKVDIASILDKLEDK